MADFPGLKLTDAGRELQAKAQTGQRLVFTRVGLGDGAAPESLGPLTALVNERQSLSIQHQEAPGDGTATLRVILTNEGLDAGFFMREMGVYAEDPDTQQETLYSYTNAGEHPDFLPASGGATLVEQIFNLITIIGDAENVTAKIDDYITIALKSEVDALAPYVLPKAGNVGQMVRKVSNAEGDTEWFDPELDGFDVRLTSIEEPRTAVANQRTFTLQKTLTNGLAVYINGERISREKWSALSATQLQLNDALEAGTRVLFVNNEEAGPGRALNVSLNGPTLVYPGQSNTYMLSDYDAFAVYSVSTTVGTVSRDGTTITLMVPSGVTDTTLDLSVTRDNVRATFRVAIGDAAIATPEITYPSNGATGVDFEPDLSATALVVYPDGYDRHISTRWQVATDSNFTNLVFDSSDDTANLTAINLGAENVRLASATRYYVRVRYQGETLASEWSAVSYFNTALIYVRQPRITAPTDGETGVVEQPRLQGDAFSVYNATDGHVATDWQLLDAEGDTVWQSLNDTTHKTSIELPVGALQEGANSYTVRVRYHSQRYGASVWSNPVRFTTAETFAYVLPPVVTNIANNQTGLPESPTLEVGVFETDGGSDSHHATDWRVTTPGGNTVWESLNDTEQLNSCTVPRGVLAEGTAYRLAVRFHGTTLGASDWSTPITFTTATTFVPVEEVAMLVASDGTSSDYFGCSVALSNDGNRAVVGAYYAPVEDGQYGTTCGAVYVFDKMAGGWQQNARLTAANPQSLARFGAAVAISGDGKTIVVGEPGRDYSTYTSNKGAFYIFTLTAENTWVLEHELEDGGEDFATGAAVAIDEVGNRVVVGQPGSNNQEDHQGSIYIFDRNAEGQWPTPGAGSRRYTKYAHRKLNGRFGTSLGISDDGKTIIVGAPGEDGDRSKVGNAWVFNEDLGWNYPVQLKPDNVRDDRRFGQCVAISGDGMTAVVGASHDLSSVGSAFAFRPTGSTWDTGWNRQRFASSGAFSTYYGGTLDVNRDGSIIIVGCTANRNGDPHVHLYAENTPGAWERVLHLVKEPLDSLFGYAVALDGDGRTAMIGALRNDTVADDAGALFVYE